MKLKRKIIFYAILLLALFSRRAHCEIVVSEESPPAFEVGEKLKYRLGWQFITAGYAYTEVMPDEEIEGRKLRSFKMSARTNNMVDPFFKVRDKLTSMTEYDLSRAIIYKKNQREGKINRQISVKFDWKTLTALYEEALKKRTRTTPILEKTLDPLSAFYFVRMQKLDVGSVITGPISDGKRCKISEIRVVAKETIKVNGKKYKTFKMIPDLKDVGGVFEKSKDAKIEIWVTADHRHIPVRMKSKVVVGSFIAELVE